MTAKQRFACQLTSRGSRHQASCKLHLGCQPRSQALKCLDCQVGTVMDRLIMLVL